MFPRILKYSLVSCLSHVFYDGCLAHFELGFMLAYVVLITSERGKEMIDLVIRVISPLAFVCLIRKWNGFRDESSILVLTLLVGSWHCVVAMRILYF